MAHSEADGGDLSILQILYPWSVLRFIAKGLVYTPGRMVHDEAARSVFAVHMYLPGRAAWNEAAHYGIATNSANDIHSCTILDTVPVIPDAPGAGASAAGSGRWIRHWCAKVHNAEL